VRSLRKLHPFKTKGGSGRWGLGPTKTKMQKGGKNRHAATETVSHGGSGGGGPLDRGGGGVGRNDGAYRAGQKRCSRFNQGEAGSYEGQIAKGEQPIGPETKPSG